MHTMVYTMVYTMGYTASGTITELPKVELKSEELFAALSEFLAATGMPLAELFAHFDRSRSGKLSAGEAAALVRTLMPQVRDRLQTVVQTGFSQRSNQVQTVFSRCSNEVHTVLSRPCAHQVAGQAAQENYLVAMLDFRGNFEVGLGDLTALKEHCTLFGVDLKPKDRFEVKDALLKLAGYMVVKDMSAKEVFKQFEPNGSMDVAALRALFAMLLPAIASTRELKDIVTTYQRMDQVRAARNVKAPAKVQIVRAVYKTGGLDGSVGICFPSKSLP
eukprot:1189695-Prorocentrum_minimum.AAC.1